MDLKSAADSDMLSLIFCFNMNSLNFYFYSTNIKIKLGILRI